MMPVENAGHNGRTAHGVCLLLFLRYHVLRTRMLIQNTPIAPIFPKELQQRLRYYPDDPFKPENRAIRQS